MKWTLYFPMRKLASVLLLCLAFTAGCSRTENSVDDFRRRPVTLPDGTVVKAEVMTHEKDMMRGMMFRDSLPEGQALLFIHGEMGNYPYWMYQVKVPLDIIWLDTRGTVVEISENTPPCTLNASQCPNYGGSKRALAVLELPGGYGKKHGVELGTTIRF